MPERSIESQQEPLLGSATAEETAEEMGIDIEALRFWGRHGQDASSTSSQPSLDEKHQTDGRTVSLLHPRTWTRKMIIIAVALVALICIVPAIAVPVALSVSTAAPDALLGNGTALRVMPLGASITYGYRSTDGNGYRYTLRTLLTSRGNAVNMVGSRQNGTMDDNDVEGWPGLRIDQVLTKAQANVSVSSLLPNIVLINVGTNDCLQNFNVSGAADRLRTLVTDVRALSPKAAFVLSTLILNTDSTVDARVQTVNAGIRTLVTSLQSTGFPIVLAEMHGDNGPQTSEMVDQTHPNDTGYAKMGTIFNTAMQEVSDRGFIQAAENNGLPDNGATTQ